MKDNDRTLTRRKDYKRTISKRQKMAIDRRLQGGKKPEARIARTKTVRIEITSRYFISKTAKR